jgi:hypothetical protein
MAQTTVTFTLDSADVTKFVDAICALHGYSDTLPGGGANPETRNAFAKRMTYAWWSAQDRAYQRVLADARPEITGT